MQAYDPFLAGEMAGDIPELLCSGYTREVLTFGWVRYLVMLILNYFDLKTSWKMKRSPFAGFVFTSPRVGVFHPTRGTHFSFTVELCFIGQSQTWDYGIRYVPPTTFRLAMITYWEWRMAAMKEDSCFAQDMVKSIFDEVAETKLEISSLEDIIFVDEVAQAFCANVRARLSQSIIPSARATKLAAEITTIKLQQR